MQEEDSGLVSDLIEAADFGAPHVDMIGDEALSKSLRRLIAETRSGFSEFSGFQNHIAPPRPSRGKDE
ncbi:hypothetical protein AB0F72_25910 [Actinoplanes sp. NPDC023936]|uniref:hypothetical protein n=1 Tax=Actinoplanes sp. NPDC023936 TaxID=3154910 RepID=UPI0033F191EC